MALYEHVFLARQDISQPQVEALTKEFSDVITQGGGKVTKSEYWGLKGLAFKIKKSRKAHYALLNIDAPPAAVQEMERRMGISSDIIRFMTVRVETLESEPSVMMRKQDRDERGDRGERGFGGGGRGGFGGGGGRGGFRGDREGGGGGRSFDREGGREGGSTFRTRPPREGGGPPREGGGPPREGGFRDRDRGPGGGGGDGPRPPRPPRNDNPGSEA